MGVPVLPTTRSPAQSDDSLDSEYAAFLTDESVASHRKRDPLPRKGPPGHFSCFRVVILTVLAVGTITFVSMIQMEMITLPSRTVRAPGLTSVPSDTVVATEETTTPLADDDVSDDDDDDNDDDDDVDLSSDAPFETNDTPTTDDDAEEASTIKTVDDADSAKEAVAKKAADEAEAVEKAAEEAAAKKAAEEAAAEEAAKKAAEEAAKKAAEEEAAAAKEAAEEAAKKASEEEAAAAKEAAAKTLADEAAAAKKAADEAAAKKTADKASNKKGPLRVVVLTGQSNMVGQGSSEHLDELINVEKRPELRHLQNADGSWAERDDVYVSFDFNEEHRTGPLKALGFGKNASTDFGPEVGIGWALGDAVDDNVLLLKVATGGISLARTLRPPSSGWDSDLGFDEPTAGYGWYYRTVVRTVLDRLENIESLDIPGYDPEVGYTLSGFVYYQGWADARYDEFVNQYEENLCNFIRDMRGNLSAPELPFVIGEQGSLGPTPDLDPNDDRTPKHIAIRQIQRNVTEREEFRDSTRFAPTADLVYFTGAHYGQRADTYYEMGRRMGQALSEIIL